MIKQPTLPGAKKQNGLMTITSAPMMQTTAVQPQASPKAAPAITTKPVSTQSNYTPTQYQAKSGNVNNNMLVENRIAGLMDMNSKAGKKAIVNANNYSASRGLQSSSIATENAANAMFNYALPIAQQDAKTYSDQSFLNQQKEQEAGIDFARAKNQFGLQKDQQGYQAGESAANRNFQSQLENQKFGNQSSLQKDQQTYQAGENAADRNFQSKLEDQRFGNQSALQDDQQTYQSGENQADRTFKDQLEDKRFGFQSQLQDDQQQFQASESELGRKFTTELEGLRFNNQLSLQQDAQAFQSTLQKEMEALRFENNKGLLDIEGQQRLEQLEKQHEHSMVQMDRGAKLQNERDAILQTYQEKNINLEGAQRLAAIEAQALESAKMQTSQNDFARSMEYSNGVSGIINTGMASLAQALANPEISPTQFRAYKNNIEAMVQNQINGLDDIYGIESQAAGGGSNGDTGGSNGDSDTTNPAPVYNPHDIDYNNDNFKIPYTFQTP